MTPLIIAPSILSADFAKLGDEVRAVEVGQSTMNDDEHVLNDVCEIRGRSAQRPDPAGDVDHPGPDRPLVLEGLVLALVEAAEDHHQTVPVAGLDDAPHAGEIRLAQRSIRCERRVDGPFVPGPAALQADREGADAVRAIIGQVRQETVRVCLRVEVRCRVGACPASWR